MKVKSKSRKSQVFDEVLPELLGIPVRLKLTVPKRFSEALTKFIKDYGLHPKFDVRKILEYGLTEESDEDLEKLEMERIQPSSEVHTKYAVTKFKAYENLMDNKVLAMKLQFIVSENERLKRTMFEKGLIDSVKTEWTKEKIDEFQRKYLFGEESNLD